MNALVKQTLSAAFADFRERVLLHTCFTLFFVGNELWGKWESNNILFPYPENKHCSFHGGLSPVLAACAASPIESLPLSLSLLPPPRILVKSSFRDRVLSLSLSLAQSTHTLCRPTGILFVLSLSLVFINTLRVFNSLTLPLLIVISAQRQTTRTNSDLA